MTNTERTRKRIIRLKILEDKARKLKNRLDTVEEQWSILITELRCTEEWETFCDTNGLYHMYAFGDILC